MVLYPIPSDLKRAWKNTWGQSIADQQAAVFNALGADASGEFTTVTATGDITSTAGDITATIGAVSAGSLTQYAKIEIDGSETSVSVAADGTTSWRLAAAETSLTESIISATGEYVTALTADRADAWSLTDGTSDLMVVVTTTGALAVQFPQSVLFTGTVTWQGDAGTKLVRTLGATTFVDTFTTATGEYTTALTANLADAWSLTDGTSDLLVITTTTGGLAAAFGTRVTTTDGVASGTARVVGGRCTANVSAVDDVTAVASNNNFVAFAQTYSIPASTLKAGSRLRCRAYVLVTDASGTDTLTVEIRVGGTTIIATTAVDPGATTDHHLLEFDFIARAAPGAAASCVAWGRWTTNTGGTLVHGTARIAPTNFATNGALLLDVRAKWSSNTASTSARLEDMVVEIE